MNEWHFLPTSLSFIKPQFSPLLSWTFIVCFCKSPPFITFWLPFFYFKLWIRTLSPDLPSPLLLLFLLLSRHNCFPFLELLFLWRNFWRASADAVSSYSFGSLPFTWIGSVSLVPARCQDPDYPSQCVCDISGLCKKKAAPPINPAALCSPLVLSFWFSMYLNWANWQVVYQY